ncbi:MAG: Cupin 2 protein, partial [Chloroflexi bacterium]|nr:Cupin 2 protein [Chloroflexota bacterium]
MEQERVRTKERETLVRPNDGGMASRNGFIDRQFRGRLLVKGRDIPIPPAGQTRQADTSMYLNPDYYKDTAFQDWLIFINNIRVHSGKHIHKGGLCLFILDGKGYT